MAQYFQIVSNDKQDIRQLYPNLLEAQNVEYVIRQDEQPTQFQAQQIIDNGEPVVVVDGSGQQVAVTYQPSQLVYTSSPNFHDQGQKLFVVEQSPKQKETIIVTPTQQQPPVVLNHLQTALKTSLAIGQKQYVYQTITNQGQQMKQHVPTIVAPNSSLQLPQPRISIHAGTGTQNNAPLAPKKRAPLNKMPRTKITPAVNSRLSLDSKVGNQIQPVGLGRVVGPQEVVQKIPQRVFATAQIPQNKQLVLNQGSQPTVVVQPNTRSPSQLQQLQQQMQLQQQLQLQKQQEMQRQQQLLLQQQQQAKKKNPIHIQPSRIQQLIDNTPQSEDSIKMLVLLANGEQRLITFTLPKEQCPIKDILDQVGINTTPETPVETITSNIPGLDYMVTVGNIAVIVDEPINNPSPPTEPIEVPDEPATPVETPQQPQLPQPEPPTPPKPEPEILKELPKIIPGKLAVCKVCGYLSEDFNRCTRCKRKLPEDVKSISKKAETTKALQALTEKKQISIKLKSNTSTTKAVNNSAKKKAKPKAIEQEPVIVTLSSDEEEEESKSATPNKNKSQSNSQPELLNQKEPTISEIEKEDGRIIELHGKVYEVNKIIEMFCRVIKIGSYRYIPKNNVIIQSAGLTLRVPHPKDESNVKLIEIKRSQIVKVLVSFSNILPMIFYYVKPSAAEMIRNELGMNSKEDVYFDPIASEEPLRRITILPETITVAAKEAFKEIYSHPYSIIDELKHEEANNILYKTCPKDVSRVVAAPISNFAEIKQLLIYPPGTGGISINTEDYLCLASDQFLNDVIIDFYLKYYVQCRLTIEQQTKVHVFSTFFYKRLTTKPVKPSRKSHPMELDPGLSPAQKRHARVEKWTKSVNLFEKDYIIIPINENAHWFLAIICFPGLNGSFSMDGKPVKVEPVVKKKKTIINLPNSTALAALKAEKMDTTLNSEDAEGECSDKDEAEGDDSELDSEDEPEPTPPPVENNKPSGRVPIKQPCILIFDSLAGASRSRVVATLRDYLTCEYKAKMNCERVFNKDVIKGACPKIPQQNNFTDCGLYLLQYVESFFDAPIQDYRIPIKGLNNWFEEIEVTKKREDIAILIKELMVEYNKDTNYLPEILLPTLDGKVINNFPEEEDDEELDELEDELNEDDLNERERQFEEESSAIEEGCDGNNLTSKVAVSPIKPSLNTSASSFRKQVIDEIKPDTSEIKSSRETLTFLKTKRIIRNKSTEKVAVKKMKLSEL